MISTNKIFKPIRTYYKNNPRHGKIFIAVLALIFILSLVRILLPQTIIYSTTSWLKDQGIDATIEAININIIDGTVSLVNAEGHANGKTLFNIGLVDIYWRWAPLSEKTIVVTKIGLDKLNINTEQYHDKIIIGGVSIPLNESSGINADEVSEKLEETAEDSKSWAAELGEVIFTNLEVCYLQHNSTFQLASADSLYVDYCVSLKQMSWAGTISYATDLELLKTSDIPLSSTGNFTLNGLGIKDNKLNKDLLLSQSNTLKNVVVSGLNNLSIEQLEMNNLSLLQRDDEKHKDSVRFSQLIIDDIRLTDLNSLAINDIKMNNPGVYLVKQNQSRWEYLDWLPAALNDTNEKIDPKNSPANNEAGLFNVVINNINIKNSDFCYLEEKSTLYYCLKLAELDWMGQINYNTNPTKTNTLNLTLKGDLRLAKQRIHNESLNRDLIDFEMLLLSKLNVTGTDNISFENLELNEFTALQRSKSKNDNTAAFDKLVISQVNYSPKKININSFSLSGLSNTVSKNTNGKWEHEKWQPTKPTSPLDKTKPASKSKNDKPILISLNSLKLSSNKNILFIDNSTSPVMKMGLQNIKLDVNDIHSAKPNSKTTFDLYAKTTRHGTINIKGTAKPFADKVSFDAKGKLKGFDLRAASPATKKAIGHIIRSGQLDADLELLAVDGKLDSNIALSLYHFNIKASSKKDADKLDAKFGMPLNQTLVLLRDKDDSIHLDIPITGDVNSPEFEPMDAIIKATSKAATVTLITFYTPYGLIYAGGNLAFNLATALNFDPVDFKPGSAELQSNNKEQLNGLSKLMTEKPNIRLTLCGVTNQQDTFALFPDLKKSPDDKKVTEIILNKEQAAQLEQLARDRQINTKNQLVKESGITHDRLILCAPEHKTDDDAIAGVEIII